MLGIPRVVLLVLVVVLCALPPAAAILDSGRGRPLHAVLLHHLDRLAIASGLGLSTVEIVGHRYTAEADVLKSLALDPDASQLTYDTRAARLRLEQLPWVARATVRRRLPDRLAVTIAERMPAAIWRHEGRDELIDASGRPIVAVARGSDTGLPVFTGSGAGPAAPTLLSLLARYPELKARVAESRRIEDRRWTLVLSHGLEVLLPADGISAALARLDGNRALGMLDKARLSRLDLRLPDRIGIRRSAVEPRAAASMHKPVALRHARSRKE
jgi:cell division protein FtsQ